MSASEQTQLLDELRLLLERQVELARKGKISSVETLGKQADSLVSRIAETGILELPEFRDRRKQLQTLYDSLCMAVTAQRDDVSEKLRRIRKGRKTITTYHSNITR
ncbi:MAG: hypothetical protein ACYTEQ_00230 [Planctomycetota bacterium]|jgi:hypothetical protein